MSRENQRNKTRQGIGENMNEKGLMTQEDFAYHLSTFMDYIRRMEKGISDNWDHFEKFQNTVVRQSKGDPSCKK